MLACRSSRREGERSAKRKRHHAEHAEPEASSHEPGITGPVSTARVAPVSDARVTLEATDEVVSPSKRAKRVPVQVNILLACLALMQSSLKCLCCMYCGQLELIFAS